MEKVQELTDLLDEKKPESVLVVTSALSHQLAPVVLKELKDRDIRLKLITTDEVKDEITYGGASQDLALYIAGCPCCVEPYRDKQRELMAHFGPAYRLVIDDRYVQTLERLREQGFTGVVGDESYAFAVPQGD